jgi:hypothetical protein
MKESDCSAGSSGNVRLFRNSGKVRLFCQEQWKNQAIQQEKSGCSTKSSGKVRLFSKEQWKSQAVMPGAVEGQGVMQAAVEK